MAVGRTNAKVSGSSVIPSIGFVPSAWDSNGYITAGHWFGDTIPYSSLERASKVITVDALSAKTIEDYAFGNYSNFKTLILRSTTLCTLARVGAFQSTPIASGTGYIYVPAALVNNYKTATNWSVYANQIRAIESYPAITGG